MMDLFLRHDVYACRSGRLLVFLDVANDRYFAAPNHALELDAARRIVRTRGEDGALWGGKLLQKRLVINEPPAAVIRPHAKGVMRVWPAPLAFVAALAWARTPVDQPGALRGALDELSARRAVAPADAQRAVAEADRFRAWRPLWPRSYVCLYDTLALAWFLLCRGASCDVAFGVQAEPFAAHCWAEVERRVLNDDEDYCASFDVIFRT